MNLNVDDLKSSFDLSFGDIPRDGRAHRIALLRLRVAAFVCTIRVASLRELLHDRRMVHLPASPPALLGLASPRGVVFPVYSLAALLGAPRPEATPRWMVLLRGPEPLALAFDGFEGFSRVEQEDSTLAPAPEGDALGGPLPGALAFFEGVVRHEGASAPLLDVPALRAAIAREASEGLSSAVPPEPTSRPPSFP